MSAIHTAMDKNGNAVRKIIRREQDGSWGANMWFGSNPATSLRRYYYTSREAARNADISDVPGQRGCIGYGHYLGAS